MLKTFTTFCATSLLWSCALLYMFSSGSIERNPAHDLDGLYQPVKLQAKR